MIYNKTKIVQQCVFTFLAAIVFVHTTMAQQDSSKTVTLQKLEADLLMSYYQQDGDHSAVTGGAGTEYLYNIGTDFGLVLVLEDKKKNTHTLNFDIGVDAYTSASSDKIDPSTVSSASYRDARVYPSVSWEKDNPNKRYTIGAGVSFSKEFDYVSSGFSVSFSKYNEARNSELAIKTNVYFDWWSVIEPIELRQQTFGEHDYSKEGRQSFSGSLIYNQILGQRVQFALMTDVVYQQGVLSTPFNRVYFQNEAVARREKLPSKRLKLPLGLRLNVYPAEFLALRTFGRYYWDDWGIRSWTFSIEPVLKFGPFFSIYPFFRYYQQSSSDYFLPYGEHQQIDVLYTSDYDLSEFHSLFYGGGVKLAPIQGIFTPAFKELGLRYGRYERGDGLRSFIVSFNLQFDLMPALQKASEKVKEMKGML